MGRPDLFSITVSRLNESAPTSPTMNAYRVVAESDGTLVVEGSREYRAFSPGTWDGFELHHLPSPQPQT
jgi:hypothetical protein